MPARIASRRRKPVTASKTVKNLRKANKKKATQIKRLRKKLTKARRAVKR